MSQIHWSSNWLAQLGCTLMHSKNDLNDQIHCFDDQEQRHHHAFFDVQCDAISQHPQQTFTYLDSAPETLRIGSSHNVSDQYPPVFIFFVHLKRRNAWAAAVLRCIY